MNSNRQSKIIIGVFVTIIGGLAILNLLTPSHEFSENENRYLQEFPEFSWNRLFNAKFTAEFDAYITDQFVLRDGWISVKSLSELAMRKRSSNGIYFAKDEYLIEMFDQVDSTQYEKNLDVIGAFTARVEEGLDVSVNTMLVPTASLILRDKLPGYAPEVDQRALLEQAAQGVSGFVDVTSALESHKEEPVFYRTDHHWTSYGAFYAYSHWREQQGEPVPALEDFEETILTDRFYGTTFSKASLYTVNPDTITGLYPKETTVTVDYNNGESVTDTIYEASFLDKKDKYAVFLNANQPMIRIQTNHHNGKKLLIIKDSYANCFAQMTLADYEEIHLIDLRYFRMSVYDYLEENQISNVLILYNLKGFSSDTNLFYLTT